MIDPDDLTPSSPLHPDLEPLTGRGGLFDVGANNMDRNIGRMVRFKDADSIRRGDPEKLGLIRQYLHQIVAVQKDYQGKLCYRVVVNDAACDCPPERDFGRVADPEKVYFID